MKIAVAGAGYVGLSIATLLAQNNHVELVDVVKELNPDATEQNDDVNGEEIEKSYGE